MSRHQGLRLVVAACLALGGAGCLMRADELAPVPTLPAGPATPPTAAVKIDIEFPGNGEKTVNPEGGAPQFYWRLRMPIRKAVDLSGYVAPMPPASDGPSDIELLLNIQVTTHASIVNELLAILTLYLIPATYGEHYRLDAKVQYRDSDRVWRASAEESARRWLGLLILPGSPFAWPSSVESDICEDLTRSVLRDLHRDGAFTRPAS